MNTSSFFKAIGVIFSLVGLYFIYQSVSAYIENCNQKDWPVGTAVIIDIEQRKEYRGGRFRDRLVHDIFYEYTVNENTYSGAIRSTTDYSKQIGESFQIKYNPQSPDESTHILSPNVSAMISGIISSCVYILFSLLVTGIIKTEWFDLDFIFKRKKKSNIRKS